MELHELHVLQLGSGAIGEGKTVAGVLPAIAGDFEGAADASGGDDDGFGLPELEETFLAVVSGGPDDAAGVHEQVEDGALHVDFHAAVDAVVLEGADHFEAGAVADVREARVFVTAKVTLQDAAVLGAVEERAPGFELADALGSFLRVQFGHTPVVEVLAAAHGVGEVDAPAVAVVDVGEGGGDASFSHDGVGFAEQGFADDSDFCAGGGGFNCGAQTCAACADDQNIVGESLELGHLHGSPQGHLQNSPVVPDAHGAEADVDVGEADGDEAGPCPAHVSAVEAAHAVVEFVAHGVFGDGVEPASGEMAKGVAAEDVSGEEDDVDDENDGSDADAETVVEVKATMASQTRKAQTM